MLLYIVSNWDDITPDTRSKGWDKSRDGSERERGGGRPDADSERTHLGKIHTKSVHIQAVQEGSEALVETLETLVHELEMHEVGFEVGHGVG